MKITIPRSDLARLLASTIKVVESNTRIPILSTVLLVADGGIVTATATDMDIEIQSSVIAEADEDGAFCVSARLLDDIVKKLPADPNVTLAESDGALTVKSGRYTSRLQTLPDSDFPSFSADGFTAHFDVDLAAAVAPVKFAISTEETRYYLNGVYLHATPDGLVAVATDGHRLGKHVVASVGEIPAVIMPRKFVGLLPAGTVSVSLSDTKVRITSGETVITSKLIDGTFPDYQRVIPTGNDKIVVFDTATMAEAADRVSIVSSERGRAVKLSFDDDQVTLAVNNPDSGSATEEIVAAYEGEPIEIGFNSAYLAELVGRFPAGDIRLALADAGSPAVFTSDKTPELLCVLMPMRV
ncbi:DNA polymerase III subunit beta [Mesorhizobium sp. LSHC414A00]|uniref:DNA polymerase III subunit beta n=1 Tax=Mesorhizobium sp. LSHC414A00 TaxID=1287287 RepID=UPI0003CDD4C4|nr:DNA polymerase III subunit beta [Mesorhizobium sp. LSHC414A00]ESX78265.1 DNA polymerase III subunit beta [Mesorhizobium sp. LSHC414A00]